MNNIASGIGFGLGELSEICHWREQASLVPMISCEDGQVWSKLVSETIEKEKKKAKNINL